MKVALVYDRVNKWGGAERVLLALHELFPDAPLFTSVYDKKRAQWAKHFSIIPSFLQKIPFAPSRHELFALAMPVAFESFSFDGYDLIISITSEAAKGIITKPQTTHICYCLTPTRYLWSGYQEYFTDFLFTFLSFPAIAYLRNWDKKASRRPDHFIAISREVQERIGTYYGRESVVIYPPMTFANSKSEARNPKRMQHAKSKKEGYFLVVSRLSKFTTYKRVDLAIKACNALKLPLKIVGTGSWEKELKKMAGPTIAFVGAVSDEELASYYQGCSALIFPALEDFGLTVLEAQSFGKPVIAFRGGGALETIVEGKTGRFFDKQTRKSLMSVLKSFDPSDYKAKDCVTQAKRFDKEVFKKAFFAFVEDAMR